MSKLDVPGPLLQGGQPWGDVHPSDDDETSHDDSKVTILAVEDVSPCTSSQSDSNDFQLVESRKRRKISNTPPEITPKPEGLRINLKQATRSPLP